MGQIQDIYSRLRAESLQFKFEYEYNSWNLQNWIGCRLGSSVQFQIQDIYSSPLCDIVFQPLCCSVVTLRYHGVAQSNIDQIILLTIWTTKLAAHSLCSPKLYIIWLQSLIYYLVQKTWRCEWNYRLFTDYFNWE